MGSEIAGNVSWLLGGIALVAAYSWYSRTRNRFVPVPENDEDIVRVLRKRMSRAELGKQGLVRMSYALAYSLERDARLALNGLVESGYDANIATSETSRDQTSIIVAQKATVPEDVPAAIRWLKDYAERSNGRYRSWSAPDLHG